MKIKYQGLLHPYYLSIFLGLCVLVTGCQTRSVGDWESIGKQELKEDTNASKTLILREGDVVNITFSGAPDLNTVQQIRRDGRITMQLTGEMTAVGMTPAELEKEIIKLSGPQLVAKEVRVTVDASSFPVFVTGAVLRPGKIMSDRPITALQSIMESGGFDYSKADLTSVRVIRHEGGEIKNYRINLKLPLQGKKSDPFNLKPADIVYVPEKFAWF